MVPPCVSAPASAISPFNRLSRFFWFCAGADLELLGVCPTDHPKYTSIGLTVFLTAILAAISAGYLTFVGTNSPLLATFFGPLWGIIILNLNRFVVLSVRLEQSPFRNFLIALPRVLIALVISIVIMTPLQLKLFSPEITDYLRREAARNTIISAQETQLSLDADLSFLDSALQDLNRQWTAEKDTLAKMTSDLDPETADLSAKILRLGEEQRTQSAALSKMQDDDAKTSRELADEEAGRNGKPPGRGKAWRDIDTRLTRIRDDMRTCSLSLRDTQDQMTRLKADRDAILNRSRTEIGKLSERISNLREQRQSAAMSHSISDRRRDTEDNIRAETHPADLAAPFLSQYRALHAIAKENRAVEWIAFVLQILMLLMETAPLVAKFLSPAGAYEKILILEEQRIVSAYRLRVDLDRNRQGLLADDPS